MLEEGINEAGSTCSWIAAATSYANHGMQHGAVLYLLFDVRLSARRRFHLGRRRHARARLSARRDRRPHHAGRRGTAAPGRPQPAGGDDGAELPRLRSDLRLRARGHHPGRPAAHVRRGRGRLLLHLGDERELRAAGAAAGRARAASCRAAICCAPAARARLRTTCWAAARSCARCWPPPSCSRSSSRCRPTCTRSPASASCAARRSTASAGICCIRARRRACPTCRRCWASSEGPIVAATDYVRNVPDQIRQWVHAARTSRSAPMASAAAMRARRCAGISKSIATSSRWRRSRRWPMPDQIDRRTVVDGDRARSASIRPRPNPLTS